MANNSAKEVKQLIQRLRREGFLVQDKKHGWMIRRAGSPAGVMIHRSSPDRRTYINYLAELRRTLDWEG